MRGRDYQQSAMYSYLSPEQRVPADHPLRSIREMTDRALKGLSKKFNAIYSAPARASTAMNIPAHTRSPFVVCSGKLRPWFLVSGVQNPDPENYG
jgi:hypothetical protein